MWSLVPAAWSVLLGVALAAPLPRKVVDLTHAFDAHAHKYPPFRSFNLTVTWNGTIMEGDKALWVQAEDFSSTTHAGTHMDAPLHFVPGGADIDDIPLDALQGPAAVVDIVDRAAVDPDALLLPEDLQRWERAAGRTLDGHILLVRTGWGQKYHNQSAYLGTADMDPLHIRFPGIGEAAARWLVENRRLKGVGVDCLSLDRGIAHDFPAHLALLGAGLYGLENVANLEQLPAAGAELHVMPMKITGASGAPTRVVAVYVDVLY